MTTHPGGGNRNAVPARQVTLSFADFGDSAIPHQTGTDAGTLRIVSSWAFGGQAAQSGGDLTLAIEFALEMAGYAAGGYAIEYEALDDSTAEYDNVWDATTEIENANRALADPEIVAFVGGVHSGALRQSLPVLNLADPPLLVVSPAATWPGLTRRVDGVTEGFEPGQYAPGGTPNFVRFAPTDDRLGQVAARWALNAASRRTAAVFHDGGRYGRCIALSFAAGFAAGGGVITETTALPADPLNFDRAVESVATAGADCVVIGGIATPAIAQLIRELRARFPAESLTILGGDGLIGDLLTDDDTASSAEGLTVVGPLLPADFAPGTAGATWTQEMRARIGDDRDPDPFAIHAFEAAIGIVQAIDAAGSGDRADILAAMRATRDFQGLSEIFSVGAAGDRDTVPIRLATVQDGRFVTVAIEQG